MNTETEKVRVVIRILGDFKLSVGTVALPAIRKYRKAELLLGLLALDPTVEWNRRRQLYPWLWPNGVKDPSNSFTALLHQIREVISPCLAEQGCIDIADDLFICDGGYIQVNRELVQVDVNVFRTLMKSAANEELPDKRLQKHITASKWFKGLLFLPSEDDWPSQIQPLINELYSLGTACFFDTAAELVEAGRIREAELMAARGSALFEEYQPLRALHEKIKDSLSANSLETGNNSPGSEILDHRISSKSTGYQLSPGYLEAGTCDRALFPVRVNTEEDNNLIEHVSQNQSGEKAASIMQTQSGNTRIFCVQHERNRHFSGRDKFIKDLHAALRLQKEVVLKHALYGLGGIGKTQTAVEYCYRYQSSYHAVLWANAETSDNLDLSFIGIATALHLPESAAEDRRIVVAAVHRWLSSNSNWLLVLDNADDPSIVKRALPTTLGGSVLITTRSADMINWNVDDMLELTEFGEGEAEEFLLRRTKRTDCPEDEREAAKSIAYELGFLPLALEQAAAYIVKQNSRFAAYLQGFRANRQRLLANSVPTIGNYPTTVATTWSMNFQKVKEASEQSARILNMCAFLYPTSIPRWLFSGMANDDELLLDEYISPLTGYSLVRLNVEQGTLDIHRLVQVVLRDSMASEAQKESVLTASTLLTTKPYRGYIDWEICNSVLPHQLACADHIERLDLRTEEAVELLNQAGWYQRGRGMLKDALRLYLLARQMSEQWNNNEHPLLARTLNDLAVVYIARNELDGVGDLFERALAIRESVFGRDAIETAITLNDMAQYQTTLGNYHDALEQHQRALDIRIQRCGENSLDTAISLSNMGVAYRLLGQHKESYSYFKRALEIREEALGSRHFLMSTSLNNLGCTCEHLGLFDQAIDYLKKALEIREPILGSDHHLLAFTMNDLGTVYRLTGRFAEAEDLYMRVLSIRERTLGENHMDTAGILNNLGLLYETQGRLEEAERHLRRAYDIRSRITSGDNPILAISLNDLGMICRKLGRLTDAADLCTQALEMRRQCLGDRHPETAAVLNNLGLICQEQGQYRESEAYFREALSIRTEKVGRDHIWTAITLHDLADLLLKIKKYDEAKTLFERALNIRMRDLPADHADTIATKQGLGRLQAIPR